MNTINDNINVISTFFLSLISTFLCLYVNESGPNQTIVRRFLQPTQFSHNNRKTDIRVKMFMYMFIY